MSALLALMAALAAQHAPAPAASGSGFQTMVVVTAERRPEKLVDSVSSIAVLSSAELQQLPALSLAEVLSALPGYLMLLAQPGAGRPVLITRGFFGGGEAEYVTGLLDDAALGDADSGLVEWRLVPTWMLDRLEVVRGAASAAYGDTAFAGVVHGIVRDGQPASLQLSADQRGSLTGGAVGGVARARWTLFGAASGGQTSGFREGADEDHGLLHLKAERTSGNATLRLSTRASHLRRADPGAIPLEALSTDARTVLPAFRNDRETTGRLSAAVEYGLLAGRGWNLLARGHLTRRGADRLRTVLLLAELPLAAQQDADSSTLGASAQAALTSRLFRPADTHIGIDVARDTLTSAYGADDRAGLAFSSLSGARQRLGVYAAHSMQLLPPFRVTGGLRLDRIRDDFAAGALDVQAWSPRIGAVLATGSGSRAPILYAQVNRAFKAPTLNQRFDNRAFPDFRGGTFTISNPGLRAQRSLNVEGGVRHAIGRFSWDAAAYRMRVTDEIDFDSRTFRYANIASSHHHGIEASAQLTPSGSTAGGLTYSWMRVYSADDPARRQLKNIPAHVLRIWGRAVPGAQIAVTAVVTYARGAFLDDDARFPLEPGGGLDLRAARSWKRLGLAVELLNALDAKGGAYGYVVPDLRGREQPFVYPGSGRTARLRCSFAF